MANAVEIQGVSKRFRLLTAKYSSLKERMLHLGKIPYEDFWAVKDVNLTVEEGETVGLLGHNGSGKSTLLKCIGGILQPTTGEIKVRGRLAALLEVGAGFHPDMSGRDNVFLNASLLGLSRREVTAKFDEIVAFAELEHSIDQQVKYYSSGMYVRLGFAVAVNVDPDILLVDEVLAVGDELFQRKCMDRVRQFQREGRTIIFVTHSPDQVRQVCQRAAVMDEGVMVALGDPATAVRSYREHLLRRQGYVDAAVAADTEAEVAATTVAGSVAAPSVTASPVQITGVEFDYPESEHRRYLLAGEPLAVKVGYDATVAVDDLSASVTVYDQEGHILWSWQTDMMGIELGLLDGAGQIVFAATTVPLMDGTYPVTVGLYGDGGNVYDWHEQRYNFEVMAPTKAQGLLKVDVEVTVGDGEALRSVSAA